MARLLVLLLALPGVARADGAPQIPAADLDGFYLTVGPAAALVHHAGSWGSGAGAEIGVSRVVERSVPALLGLCGGGLSYSEAPGGRLWLEAEVAFERLLPVAVGAALGVSAEVDATAPPRWGAHGTLWVFAGVFPYVRAGAVEESGAFVEIGLMAKIPIIRP
jgi:hypothetical protein